MLGGDSPKRRLNQTITGSRTWKFHRKKPVERLLKVLRNLNIHARKLTWNLKKKDPRKRRFRTWKQPTHFQVPAVFYFRRCNPNVKSRRHIIFTNLQCHTVFTQNNWFKLSNWMFQRSLMLSASNWMIELWMFHIVPSIFTLPIDSTKFPFPQHLPSQVPLHQHRDCPQMDVP